MRTQRSGNLITTNNLAMELGSGNDGRMPEDRSHTARTRRTYLCGHFDWPHPVSTIQTSCDHALQLLSIDKWPFHMWNGNSIDFSAPNRLQLKWK